MGRVQGWKGMVREVGWESGRVWACERGESGFVVLCLFVSLLLFCFVVSIRRFISCLFFL